MASKRWVDAGVTSCCLAIAGVFAFAPRPAAISRAGQGVQPPMSFFVTSVGKGDGANLGGLAGADAHCQRLAGTVGRGGVTWHAYLSTQGPNAVSARDRIGAGPWYNARGELIAKDVNDLHRLSGEIMRGNPPYSPLAIDEKNEVVPGEGHTPNLHDVLTGSQRDGRAFTDAADHTCGNWTSDSSGTAHMGHSDLLDRGSEGKPTSSWNSAHPSRADCSQQGMQQTGMGAGLFYCFAVK
jgi:hypothetical protein